MELIETKKNFILVNGSVALFCDRLSGHLSFNESKLLINEWNPVCLGCVKGLVGKIRLSNDGDSRLMFINKLDSVGELPYYGSISKVTKVTTIALNSASVSNLDIELCNNHHFGIKRTERIAQLPDSGVTKAFSINNLKDTMRKKAESVKPRNKEVREREKFEKRMLEEYDKMFQDGSGDNFYIKSRTETAAKSTVQSELTTRRDWLKSSDDITNNILAQNSPQYSLEMPLWRRAHPDFFWNRFMLMEAIESAEQMLIKLFGKSVLSGYHGAAATMIRDLEQMLQPIVQGYIDVEPFELRIPGISPCGQWDLPQSLPSNQIKFNYPITLALISRRNRHRAGTRYRRRGIDEDGHVANYVETEQILRVDNEQSPHVVSFVQIRGSVPVFWSQTSFKYRPPINLERSEVENKEACERHMNRELDRHGKVVVVNLVDTSRERSERKLADAFLEQLIQMNDSRLVCVMFDFHDYCKGLQFDNVSILIKGITEVFREMKYTWLDKNGVICDQKSIFRVNCVDCLDRTNVVQCMTAGVAMETQLRKLGLLCPEESLPPEFHQIMQNMWANNGDALSHQYSGTAAMKGDFTRTGMRTMNGLVKDGVSSVNRYYLRLRELSRQAAIDLMIGFETSSEVVNLRSGRSDAEQKLIKQKEANIKELTLQCKSACLSSSEDCLAESILIMTNENERDSLDMNTVALVSTQHIYFVKIDYQQKRQPIVIKLPLNIITRIQMGYDSVLFRSRQAQLKVFYDVLLLHQQDQLHPNDLKSLGCNSEQYVLIFKQPSLRLFNNMLIEVKNHSEEQEESLRAIAESFYAAVKSRNSQVVFDEQLGSGQFQPSTSNQDAAPNQSTTPSVSLPSQLIVSIGNANHNMSSIYDNVQFVMSGESPADPTNPISVTDCYIDIDLDSDGLHSMPVNPSNSNFESIKKGFRNVKDKIKLGEWRDKFKTSVNRGSSPSNYSRSKANPRTTASFQGTHEEEYEGDESGSQKQKVPQQKVTYQRWINRDRLGSSSDDESSRRSNSLVNEVERSQVDQRQNKMSSLGVASTAESETFEQQQLMTHPLCRLVKSNSEYLVSNHESSTTGPNVRLRSNKTPQPTIPTEQATDKSLTNKTLVRRKSMFIRRRKLSFNQKSSGSNKIEENITDGLGDNTSIDSTIIMESCGLLRVNLTNQRTSSLNPTTNHRRPPLKSDWISSVQLSRAIGGAYQRRAERISLQLSIDSSANPRQFIDIQPIKLSCVPTKSSNQQQELPSQSTPDILVQDQSEDDVIADVMTLTNQYGEFLRLQPIELNQQKHAERLQSKQIELAQFIDQIRQKYLADRPLDTTIIIF